MNSLYGITTSYQEKEIQQLLHQQAVKYLVITEPNAASTFLFIGRRNLLDEIINLINIKYSAEMGDVVTPFKILNRIQDFTNSLSNKPSRKTIHFEDITFFESIKSIIANQASFDISATMDNIKKMTLTDD
ncbi:hypothetical protein TrispH2_001126 [Trichoplax sp. H2]|nr:hypothetical protein TrispH2_001126 [Trichoplax sp. H2]|eukprot:RDD46754.1 hypothetical protein TrispH2_001126 [Trichoplax sp. H2]